MKKKFLFSLSLAILAAHTNAIEFNCPDSSAIKCTYDGKGMWKCKSEDWEVVGRGNSTVNLGISDQEQHPEFVFEKLHTVINYEYKVAYCAYKTKHDNEVRYFVNKKLENFLRDKAYPITEKMVEEKEEMVKKLVKGIKDKYLLLIQDICKAKQDPVGYICN